MVKVSIIMPVYKAAHFIENSISSFENQTLSDFELILVNDCSPDSSLQIIKRYAEKKSNIRIVDLKENCGPMYARFEGCEIAQGEYITFVILMIICLMMLWKLCMQRLCKLMLI